MNHLLFLVAFAPLATSPYAAVESALERWQLEPALAQAQETLYARPDNPRAWRMAAHVHFFLGRHDTAAALAQAAAAADYPSAYQHVITRTATQTAGFDELSSGHFRIRYQDKDEIVAHYALPVLERALARIAPALGYDVALQAPIAVEIFPNVGGLSAATGLSEKDIETSGTIAVCRFHRLMITSPLAMLNGYTWADTLAHELIHLIISKVSHNTVPIWFHEGVAKYYESQWFGDAGQHLSGYSARLLRQALKDDGLISFAQMHPSMAKLPSQRDATLAFAEVFHVVEFLRQRFGPQVIPKILQASRAQQFEPALKTVTGWNLKQLEARWRAYAKKHPPTPRNGTADREAPLQLRSQTGSHDASEGPLLLIDDPQIHAWARLGDKLMARGHTAAALVEYTKAIEQSELRYASLVYRVARAYQASGQEEKARKLLLRALNEHSRNSDLNMLLGRLELRAGDLKAAEKHLEVARFKNPFDPRLHAGLAQTYRAHARPADADREERFERLSQRPRQPPEQQTPSPADASLSLVSRHWQSRIELNDTLLPWGIVWQMPVQSGQHRLRLTPPSEQPQSKNVTLTPGAQDIIRLPPATSDGTSM